MRQRIARERASELHLRLGDQRRVAEQLGEPLERATVQRPAEPRRQVPHAAGREAPRGPHRHHHLAAAADARHERAQARGRHAAHGLPRRPAKQRGPDIARRGATVHHAEFARGHGLATDGVEFAVGREHEDHQGEREAWFEESHRWSLSERSGRTQRSADGEGEAAGSRNAVVGGRSGTSVSCVDRRREESTTILVDMQQNGLDFCSEKK